MTMKDNNNAIHIKLSNKENSDSKLIPKNMAKWEISEPTYEQRAKWLEAMKQIADENGRVTLGGLSDGSLMGEFECLYILAAIGCIDIKTESRPATADEIPKDRPFLTWHYQVSGNLPKENKQI